MRHNVAHCSLEGNLPSCSSCCSTKVLSFQPNPSIIFRFQRFLTCSLPENISSASFPLPSSCRLLIGHPGILMFPDPAILQQVAKQNKSGLPSPACPCSRSWSSRVTIALEGPHDRSGDWSVARSSSTCNFILHSTVLRHSIHPTCSLGSFSVRLDGQLCNGCTADDTLDRECPSQQPCSHSHLVQKHIRERARKDVVANQRTSLLC